MLNHGINTYKSDTNFGETVRANVGIPFFVGCWPCHRAGGYVGKPQIAFTFDDAVALGGYSDDWRTAGGSPKWNLCQAMYGFLKEFGIGPAVFYNVFDPATHKTAVAAADIDMTDGHIDLPFDAIIDSGLVVKNSGTTLTLDADYEVSYSKTGVSIDLLSTGASYATLVELTSLNVAYNKANPEAITATDITSALEKIELCKNTLGVVPDLICVPGWSQNPTIASVMATKAASINGLFRGKAVVDINTAVSGGADAYDEVATWKTNNAYTDDNMIVCWPMAKIGDKLYDFSVLVCGVLATVDYNNEGIPFESPSNKKLPITALVDASGNDINMTVQEADVVSVTAGVVTALNYDGWRLWGNYTGAHPSSTDVAKVFICTNRMQDFLSNQFVNMFWDYVDRPICRVTIDAIVNEYNGYLAGLVGAGKLFAGEVAYVSDNNPTANLLAGMFRLDCSAASPVPAQRIDFYIEYDFEALTASLNV